MWITDDNVLLVKLKNIIKLQFYATILKAIVLNNNHLECVKALNYVQTEENKKLWKKLNLLFQEA